MNITAIKRHCVARRRAVILDTIRGEQWITNGVTAWVVEGLRLNEEAVEALFDLSEKQRRNMIIVQKPTADLRYTAQNTPGEESTDEAGRMEYMGETFIALPSSPGMLFIPETEIKHIKEDSRFYAVRWGENGQYVAVYNGFFCEALVMPLDNRSAEEMQKMAMKMAAPVYRWNEVSDAAADAEAAAEALIGKMSADVADE